MIDDPHYKIFRRECQIWLRKYFIDTILFKLNQFKWKNIQNGDYDRVNIGV